MAVIAMVVMNPVEHFERLTYAKRDIMSMEGPQTNLIWAASN